MSTQRKFFDPADPADPADYASYPSAQAAIARANEFLKIAENVSEQANLTRGLNVISQALVQLELNSP